ncbi:MAG: ATP-binding protein [Chloroflexota bacterium]
MPTFYLSQHSITFVAQGLLLLAFVMYMLTLPKKTRVVWYSIGFAGAGSLSLLNYTLYLTVATPSPSWYLIQRIDHFLLPWLLVFMAMLSYDFPRPTLQLARESKIVARIIAGTAAVLSLLVFVVDDVFLVTLFRIIVSLLLLATIWSISVLIRRTLVHSAVHSVEPTRSRIRALLAPSSAAAVVTRNCALIYLLPILYIVVGWLLATSRISTYGHSFILTLLVALPVLGFSWFWLNHVPAPTTFMVKVVGISLFSLMVILSHVGNIIGPAFAQAYQPTSVIPNKSQIRFYPTEFGGYTVSSVPYNFQTEWGERLTFEQTALQRIPLSFTLPYFEQRNFGQTDIEQIDEAERSYLFIYRNGLITFARPYIWENFLAHGQSAIIPLYARFVEDDGDVYLKSTPSAMTVTWHNLRFDAHSEATSSDASPASANTFQLLLQADGTIDFSYQNIARPVIYRVDPAAGIWLRGILPGNQTPVTSHGLTRNVSYTGQPGEALIENHYLDFRRYLHQQLLPLLYIVLASFVVIILGFPFFLHHALVKPLNTLVRATRQIDRNPALPVTIPVRQEDEIGILTNSFNGMVQALQQLNTTLEERVQARTNDLTENNQHLAQAKEEAEAANLAKSRFLSNASHELRTPLAAILGYTTILKRASLSAKEEKWVNNLDNSGKHLLAIINDLLDLSKLEADKLTLAPRAVHLPNFLSELVSMMSGLTEQKNLELYYEADPNLPTYVLVDVHRLRQVLLNLLANAIKFTEHGHVRLTVIPSLLPWLQPTTLSAWRVPNGVNGQPRAFHRPGNGRSAKPSSNGVTHALSPNSAVYSSTYRDEVHANEACEHEEDVQSYCRLHFAVSDSGVGIDPEQQETIFEPFEQAGIETERSHGTGLGLTICRLFVELMESEINLESELGRGSTFWFELDLPLLAAERAEVSQEDSGKQTNGTASSAAHRRVALHDGGIQGSRASHFPLRHRQEDLDAVEWKASQVAKPRNRSEQGVVLVIDDNLDNLNILTDFLQNDGFTVIESRDGVAGIQQAERTQPDLILLDILMTNIDGFETCRRLKENPATREIPVLFMTALTEVENKIHGFAQGAADYITKPFQEEETLARVRAHINSRRLTLMEERQRLSRDLHDSVTQSLYSLVMMTSGWQDLAQQGQFQVAQAKDAFSQTMSIAQQALNETRLLLEQLRPVPLNGRGLVEALQQRLDLIKERTSLTTNLTTNSPLETLDPSTGNQLYYIAQEAINNTVRHASATKLTVSIDKGPVSITLSVQDNGCGFVPSNGSIGLGLTTMQERCAMIGGQLKIESEPQNGTTVQVIIDNH